MNLTEIKNNTPVTIKSISNSSIALRLSEYGIFNDSSIIKVNQAPLRGPILIKSNNIKIALRRSEALSIEVIHGS